MDVERTTHCCYIPLSLWTCGHTHIYKHIGVYIICIVLELSELCPSTKRSPILVLALLYTPILCHLEAFSTTQAQVVVHVPSVDMSGACHRPRTRPEPHRIFAKISLSKEMISSLLILLRQSIYQYQININILTTISI